MTEETVAQKHFLLEISFDGTEYYGWQIQPELITVQKVLQDKLKQLYAGQDVKVQGSSRTDAGVHGLALAVSFTAPLRPNIPKEQVHIALNALLPDTIRVRTVQYVDEDFNARFSAKGKAYTYVVNNSCTTGQLPISNRYSWHQHKCNNIDAMREAAQHLIGTHDFSSFAVHRSQIDSAVRTIYDIEIKQIGRYLCITYSGDGFLYKMIRCLTGALVAVGNGRITVKELRELRDLKNRNKGQITAPPQGLFLMKVFYGDYKWQDFELETLPFAY